MLSKFLGLQSTVRTEIEAGCSDNPESLIRYAIGYADAWNRRTVPDSTQVTGINHSHASHASQGAVGLATEPQVKFYFDPVFRGLSVWTLIESSKIPYEQCLINLMRGDMETEEMLLANPFSRVPALQIGGEDTPLITSRMVMLQYLAAEFPRHTAKFACSSLGFPCSTVNVVVHQNALVCSALESLVEVERIATLLIHNACGFWDERSKDLLSQTAQTPQNRPDLTWTDVPLPKRFEAFTYLLSRFREKFLKREGMYISGATHPTLADLYFVGEILYPLQLSGVHFQRLDPFFRKYFRRVCKVIPEFQWLAEGTSNTIGFGLGDYVRLIHERQGAISKQHLAAV